jgi:hypothetical protein
MQGQEESKKQEKLISSVKAKATKATAKAKELRLKLAAAINAADGKTPPADGLSLLQDLAHHPIRRAGG